MLYEQLRQNFFDSYANRFQNAEQPDLTAGIMVPNIKEKYEHLPFLFVKPIYQWMQLEIEYFPPSSHWQEGELKILCASFRQLFEAYNYWAAMPWDLELAQEYDFWLEMIKRPSVCYLDMGEGTMLEIDICKGQEHSCPFGDGCVKYGDDHCFQYLGSEYWSRYDL